jgi:RimJ/RimL family protein N-acetyltransferase
LNPDNINPSRDHLEGSTWRVRPIVAEDFDELFGLVTAVAAEGKWIGVEGPLDRDVALGRWRAELENPASQRWVALVDGRLIGEATVTIASGIATLAMQVSADYRGQGVGHGLLDQVVSWSRDQGAYKLTLTVWPHNHPARQLYERFGFVEEGRLRRHYRRKSGELWDGIVMGLVLDETSLGSRYADEE